MAPDPSFKDYVIDQLRDPEVDARSMFGGFGLYRAGDFFAIVYADRLYFRTDDETRDRYVGKGSGPFRPNERQTLKSYYEVPGDVVEDRDELARWAHEALGAGRNARRDK